MSRAIAPEPERTAETAMSCVVNSWNEWDPLEEVVVGRLEGAAAPPREAAPDADKLVSFHVSDGDAGS